MRESSLTFEEIWSKVRAPAGTHTYTFRYLPWDVPLRIILAIGGWIACFYFWFAKNRGPFFAEL
jgi:hypothetical protein